MHLLVRLVQGVGVLRLSAHEARQAVHQAQILAHLEALRCDAPYTDKTQRKLALLISGHSAGLTTTCVRGIIINTGGELHHPPWSESKHYQPIAYHVTGTSSGAGSQHKAQPA